MDRRLSPRSKSRPLPHKRLTTFCDHYGRKPYKIQRKTLAADRYIPSTIEPSKPSRPARAREVVVYRHTPP